MMNPFILLSSEIEEVAALIKEVEDSLAKKRKKKGQRRSPSERRAHKKALKRLRKLTRSKASLELKRDAMLSDCKESENDPFHPLNNIQPKTYADVILTLMELDRRKEWASPGEHTEYYSLMRYLVEQEPRRESVFRWKDMKEDTQRTLAERASIEKVQVIKGMLASGVYDLDELRQICQYYTDLSLLMGAMISSVSDSGISTLKKATDLLVEYIALDILDCPGRKDVMDRFEDLPGYKLGLCETLKHVTVVTPELAAILALKSRVTNMHKIRLTGLCDNKEFTGLNGTKSTFNNLIGFFSGTSDDLELGTLIEKRMRRHRVKVPGMFPEQKRLDALNALKRAGTIFGASVTAELEELTTAREAHFSEIMNIVREATGNHKYMLDGFYTGHFTLNPNNQETKMAPTMVSLPSWLQDLLNQWCEHTGQQPMVRTITLSSKSGPGYSYTYVPVVDNAALEALPLWFRKILDNYYVNPSKYLLKFPQADMPVCTWKAVGNPPREHMLSQLVPTLEELQRILRDGEPLPANFSGNLNMTKIFAHSLFVPCRIIDECNIPDGPDILGDACFGSM